MQHYRARGNDGEENPSNDAIRKASLEAFKARWQLLSDGNGAVLELSATSLATLLLPVSHTVHDLVCAGTFFD